MRIENITDKTLKNLLDEELSHLRSRCLNIFDRYFALSDVQKAVGMDRKLFLTKYLLLRTEMESRGIKLFRDRPLDKEVHNRIFKASLWNLDVPALGDMVAIPNYVSICGEFIKSPLVAEKIDIVIRTAKEHRNEVFEAKIGNLVKEQMNKEPNFIYEPKGPDKSYIPLFDLMLKSHEETRKVKKVKQMVVVEKGTIAFKDLGTAEEATVWAGAKETVKAEVDDLKQICAWYDSSKPDIKSSYKLPHHRMSDKKAVWRAVSAAMAALLGARGGVDIPDADRKGVYNHLVGHYKQFDKEVPELKKYDAEELEKVFPIEKPEETENTIRIPVGSDCEVTATITIDKGQGISALYCGKIKRVRTFLFDKRVKAWTMASAKAWIKEHSAKTEKALGEGRGVGGPRQGVGGAEICVCPKCGYEEEHERGEPCNKIKCPECGTPMVGKAQKQTMFKIIKVDKAKRLAGGIVYEPETEDTQGDFASKEEIEKALTSFMKRYATDTKRIKINHKGKRYFFPIIESFIPDTDIVKGGETIPAGAWWLMIHISNDRIWQMVENKELEGFSMGGRSKAKP